MPAKKKTSSKKTITKVAKKATKKIGALAILLVIVFLVIGVAGGYFINQKLNGNGESTIKVNGDSIMHITKGSSYSEKGVTIIINGQDFSNEATVSGNVDTSVCGAYYITYTYQHGSDNITLSRVIVVEE